MNHHILILWGPSGEGELRSGRWGEKSRKNAGIVRRWDSPVGKLKTYVVKCGIFFGDEYLSIISIIWFWQFLKDRLNSQFAIENGHRHSGFTHEKICTKNRKLYWLLLWNIWIIFPFSWEFHHPNWRTHIFQRGRYTTNQRSNLRYVGM